MIKVNSIEMEKMKLMPYTIGENNYVANLYKKMYRYTFDDIERGSISLFESRVKQMIDIDSVCWVCWMKNPVVKVGTVGFSNVISGISALFHFVLDVSGYKSYVRNNGSIKFKVMDEASKVAIGYMFSVLKLQRITGQYFVNNRLAINLCKGLGFKEEGIIRRGTKVDGKPVDIMILGLLREELI